jgi:hypothetical protein
MQFNRTFFSTEQSNLLSRAIDDPDERDLPSLPFVAYLISAVTRSAAASFAPHVIIYIAKL